MDDELRMVRSLLDKPAPEPAVVAMGRDRLRTAARARGRTRPARRTMWMTGGLGLTAAAAAAAVAISATGAAGDRPGGTRPRTGGPTVTLSARSILLAAATEADGQTDKVGRYWHTTTVNGNAYRVTGGYTVIDRSQQEQWTPSLPQQEQWGSDQRLGARPDGPADTAAWKRAGSPTTFTAPAPKGPGKGKLEPMPLSTQPGRPNVNRSPLVDGDKVFWLGRNVSMKDLRALPADPQRLKASLKRWYAGHGTESSSDPMSSDLWLYTVAKGLITDMPVTPKVRGAAFRMLADLKTVTAIGSVKDAQGRPGTAIAITEHTKFGGVQQHRLILDTATGRALGEEIVVVQPSGTTAGLAPGSVWISSMVVAQGWTDSAPGSTSGAQRGH
ncbi:CU044_5270 family protein [Actinoallomurus vinaceus]|uniref:CU044_5270 family protein n=1 Tax=Actinoallomurus vinaceus TaxID=1080074 RepID=A0ABP8UQT7_9ACTN